MGIVRAARRFLELAVDNSQHVIATATLVLMVFTPVNAMLRYVFAKPVWAAEEINGLFLGLAITAGWATALKQQAHIRVQMFSFMLPKRVNQWLEELNSVMTVIWSACLFIGCMFFLQYVVKGSVATQSLQIPVAWPLTLYTIGALLFFLQSIVELQRTFVRRVAAARGETGYV